MHKFKKLKMENQIMEAPSIYMSIQNRLVPRDIFSKDCEIVEQLHYPCQLGTVPITRKL
ncbi:hypothetical protein Mapa_001092 [Marchantia paleacea]|nr:hypothetical protein Mapa_001092 [Marchantia paleacea]